MSSCSPSSRPSPFRQETPLSHYSAQSSIPHIPHRIFLIPKKCVSSSIYRGLFNKVPEPQSAFTTMWYGDHPLPHGNQGTFGAWRFSLSLECTRTWISSPSEFGPRHPDARLNWQPMTSRGQRPIPQKINLCALRRRRFESGPMGKTTIMLRFDRF